MSALMYGFRAPPGDAGIRRRLEELRRERLGDLPDHVAFGGGPVDWCGPAGLYLDWTGCRDGARAFCLGFYVRTDSAAPGDPWDIHRLGGPDRYVAMAQCLERYRQLLSLEEPPAFFYCTKEYDRPPERVAVRLCGTFGEIVSFGPYLSGLKRRWSASRIKAFVETPDNIRPMVHNQLELEQALDEIEFLPWQGLTAPSQDPAVRHRMREEAGPEGLCLDWSTLATLSPDLPVDPSWNPPLSERDVAWATALTAPYREVGRKLAVVQVRKRRGWAWGIAQTRAVVEGLDAGGWTVFLLGERATLMSAACADPTQAITAADLAHIDAMRSFHHVVDLMDNTARGITYRELTALALQAEVVVGLLSGFQMAALMAARPVPVVAVIPAHEVIPAGFRRRFLLPEFYLVRSNSRLVVADATPGEVLAAVEDVAFPCGHLLRQPCGQHLVRSGSPTSIQSEGTSLVQQL